MGYGYPYNYDSNNTYRFIRQRCYCERCARKKVINFSVAVTQGYGESKTTLWVDVAKWGEKTAVAEYLKKGVKVAVSGEPSLRVWEKDGKHGASITLRANEIELLGSKNDAQASTQPTSAPSNEPDPSDDLPF